METNDCSYVCVILAEQLKSRVCLDAGYCHLLAVCLVGLVMGLLMGLERENVQSLPVYSCLYSQKKWLPWQSCLVVKISHPLRKIFGKSQTHKEPGTAAKPSPPTSLRVFDVRFVPCSLIPDQPS